MTESFSSASFDNDAFDSDAFDLSALTLSGVANLVVGQLSVLTGTGALAATTPLIIAKPGDITVRYTLSSVVPTEAC